MASPCCSPCPTLYPMPGPARAPVKPSSLVPTCTYALKRRCCASGPPPPPPSAAAPQAAATRDSHAASAGPATRAHGRARNRTSAAAVARPMHAPQEGGLPSQRHHWCGKGAGGAPQPPACTADSGTRPAAARSQISHMGAWGSTPRVRNISATCARTRNSGSVHIPCYGRSVHTPHVMAQLSAQAVQCHARALPVTAPQRTTRKLSAQPVDRGASRSASHSRASHAKLDPREWRCAHVLYLWRSMVCGPFEHLTCNS